MNSPIKSVIDRWKSNPLDRTEFSQAIKQYESNGDWRAIVRAYGLASLAGVEYDPVVIGAEAIATLTQMLEEQKDIEKNLLFVAIGDLYLNWKNDREAAMASFQQAFNACRQNTLCLQRARQIYSCERDYRRVIGLLEHEIKIVESDERRADLILQLAQVNADAFHDYDVALELLDTLEGMPHDVALCTELRALYQSRTCLEEFIQVLVDQAAANQTKTPIESANDYLRAAQLEINRPTGIADRAISYAARATNLSPSNTEARKFIKELHLERDRVLWPADETAPTRKDLEQNEMTDADFNVNHSEVTEVVSRGEADLIARQLRSKKARQSQDFDDVKTSPGTETDGSIPGSKSQEEPPATPLAAENEQTPMTESDHNEVEREISQVEDEEAGQPNSAAKTSEGSSKLQDEESQEEVEEQSGGEENEEGEENEGETSAVDKGDEGVKPPVAEKSVTSGKRDDSVEGAKEEVTRELRLKRDEMLAQGDVEGVIAMYEKRVKRLRRKPGEDEVMGDLARLLWLEADDWDRADYYYKRLKLLEPSNPDIEAFYTEFYERGGEWRKLLVLLMNGAAEATTEEEKRSYTRRLATLGEGPMESPKTAIDAWRAFQKDYPDDEEAASELKRLYKEEGKWSAYVEILRGEYDRKGDENLVQKIALLEEIKDIYANELKIEPMLISALQELLELDPENRRALKELREHLQSGRRYTDLAELLENQAQKAEAAGDLASASEFYLEVADMWQITLRNVSAAIPHLERVLELDPDNLKVIDRAIEVYSNRRDYAGVVRLKRKKAKLVEVEEAIDLLQEASQIAQERLRDPQIISEVLEEELQLAPDNFEAMKALKQIYDRSQDYDAQLRVRKMMIEHGFGEEAKILREIAAIASTHLNDPDRAVEAWKSVLQLQPMDPEATQALTLIYVNRAEYPELEKLYISQSKALELFDILEAAAGSSDDDVVKSKVYAQMADVAEKHLQDPERTISSLESLKETAKDPVPAAKRLLQLYGQIGHKEEQIHQLHFLIDHDHEKARPEYLRQLLDLYVDIDDRENALKTSAKLILINPRNPESYNFALEIATTEATKATLIKFIDRISATEKDPVLTLENDRRVAKLLLELCEWPGAVNRLEKLQEAFPDDLDVKRDLEVAYGGNHQPAEQVAVLETIIAARREAGATSEELVNDLTRIADIERNALNQPDQALQSYLDILDLVPEHLSSLSGLEEIYRAKGEWLEVLQVLERRRDALPFDSADERLAVLFQMAKLNVEHLANPNLALDIAQEILSSAPKHEEAITLVEGLYDHPEVGYEATILLEPYIREQDGSSRLIRNLEVRTQRSHDEFEKIDIFEQLIELSLGIHSRDVVEGEEQGVGDLHAAFGYAKKQLLLDPARQQTWQRLDDLAQRATETQLPYNETTSFNQALEQVYTEVVEGGVESQTLVEMTRKLADIRENQLEAHQGAIQAYKTLFEIDPYDLKAVEGLIRNYEATSNSDQLVSMMAKKAALMPQPEDQTKWYLMAANLADDVLEDSQRTEQYLKEIIFIQPDRYDVHRRLINFYEREEEWEKMGQQLRTYSDIEPDDPSKENALNALAKLQWQRLQAEEQAVETYRQLLLLSNGERRILEEIFIFDDHLAEISAEHPIRLDLVELSEPAIRDLDFKPALSRVLKTRLIFTQEPYLRAAQLDEYSRLREILGAPQEALEATKEAILIVPDDVQRRERFQTLCSKQNEPEFFVQTYQDAIENLEDPFLAAQMLVQKATWENEQLQRVDDAIASLERARSFDETNITAAKMLDKLYESKQDFVSLAKILKAKALLENDPNERVGSYRRLAYVQEEILDEREEAIRSWNEVLNLLPADPDAIEALERLYEREERWVDLTEILNRKIDAYRDEGARFAAMRKLAVIYENQLTDYPSAVSELQRAHRLKPNNVDVLFELRRLLGEHNQWPELDDVLQKLLATDALQRSPELKAELLLQQGDIRSIEMFEIEKAIPTYLRVLRFDFPEYRQRAVEALERISNDEAFLDTIAEPLSTYNVANERWESEVELTHKLAAKSVEPERRSLLFQRLADLYDVHLQDTQGAFDSLLSAWKETPINFNLYQRAKEKVAALGAEMEMAETISNQLMQISDPRKNIELRLDLAELYLHALENRIDAEQQFREVLLIDPGNESAQSQLEGLLVQDERWFDVMELYEQRYQNAAGRRDQEAVAVHLLQMANIQENMLADPIATVDAYRRVLDECPSNSIAREAVMRLLRDQDRWAELAEFIDENFEWFTPEEKRLRKFELAQIHQEQLVNPMLSLEHYLDLLQPGTSSTLDPETPQYQEAVHAVEEYLHAEAYAFDSVLRHTAGNLLLPIYERNEDWIAIAQTREIIARTTESPKDILANLLQSAAAYEYHLHDYENARRLRYEILSANPEKLQFLELLMNLCFAPEDWLTFANYLEDLLNDNPALDLEVRKAYENALVEVHEIRLQDINHAIVIVSHALENEPDNPELLDKLERLLSRQQDWSELALLYRRRADFADELEKRTIYLRKLAFIYEHFLKDAPEAIDIFFEILSSHASEGDGMAPVTKDLTRLLRREERWFDLVDLLQQMRETTSHSLYSFQLAEIYLNNLEQYEEAVDALEQLLIQEPNDPDVRRQLRGIQRHLASLEDDYSELELRIVDMLLIHRPLMENLKRTQELLEIRVETLRDKHEKAETYLKIAELCEQRPSMSERVHALVALTKAYQIRPYDNELFQRLSALADRTESWERVPSMLLPGLRELDEVEQQVQLLTAVAWIYRDRLADLTSTIVALQSVIDLEPSNRDALDALEESYRSNRQWKELTRILEIRVKEELDPERRRQSLENLAKLNHTITQRLPRAIENFEELRRIVPAELTYIQALEDLYRSMEQWQDLEDLLAEYANQVAESDRRVDVLARLANVQQHQTENIDGAIATNVMILDLDSENDTASLALLDLFERGERWLQLLDALQERIKRTQDPVERLNLSIKACEVNAFNTGALEDAFLELEGILNSDPYCLPAQDLLRRLTHQKESHHQALSLLTSTFENSEQWTHLEAFYETLLNDLDRDEFHDERRDVFLKLTTYHQLKSSLEDAERVASAAFVEFPTDAEVLVAFESATPSQEGQQRRLNILQSVLDCDDVDPIDYRCTRELLAKTYSHLGERQVAIEQWNQLLELDPYDKNALAALDQLYLAEENYEQLVEILEREVELSDPEPLPGLRCRLALLYETRFDEKQNALDIYRDVLLNDHAHENALEGLVRLYHETDYTEQAALALSDHFRELEAWVDFAAIVQGALPYFMTSDQIRLRRELIDVFLNRLSEREGAFALLCEAIVAEPNDYLLQTQAEELLEETNGYLVLAQVYENIEESVDDPLRRIEILSFAGLSFLATEEEPKRAEMLLEKILEIDPENQNALAGLEDLARAMQDPQQLIQILTRKAESVYEAEVQIDAYAEIARLHAAQGEFDQGIEAYRMALSLDPSNIVMMDELGAFLEVQKRYDELVSLLEQQSRFVESAEQRFDILLRAGQYSQYYLEDQNQAIRFYEEAHTLDPNHFETMVELEKLYTAQSMLDQRRQMLEQLISLNLPAETAVYYMSQLAEILQESYNDFDSAISYLQRAYELSRSLPPQVSDETFGKLQEIYAQNQRWEELNQLFEQRLAELREDQIDEQIEIRARRADIAAKHLGDTQGAINALNDLLTLSPNHYKTLAVLAGLYQQVGDLDSQLATLNRLVDSAKDLEQAVEAYRRRAKLFEEHDQAAEAVADYVKVIEMLPTDIDSINRLKEIYASFDAWEEYIRMLDFEISVAEENRVKIEKLNEAYDIAKTKLENPELMVLLLERMQEIEDDPEVIEKLIDAYISSHEIEKANNLIHEAIERLQQQRKMKDVVRYYHLKGKLAEQQGDEKGALDAYREAHGVDASYLPNLISLGQLLIRFEEWDEALKIFQTLLLHQMNVKDKSDKVSIYYNLGRIRVQQGDTRRAKDMFKRVLSIDRDHEPSRIALENL